MSFQSEGEASSAAYSAALSQVDHESRQVERNLRTSLTLLNSYDLRRLALDSARANSKQVYNSFNRQFDAGRKDWQDLLNSARELVQADVQWAQASGQYLVASWQLLLDTQGLEFIEGPQ